MKNRFFLMVAFGGLVLLLQTFPSLAIKADEPDFSEALEWWSFQPVQNVKAPDFHDTWTFNDIDRFIAVTQTAKGLKPSPDASPEVLLRRIHFDLTGLPPKPEEIASFHRDRAETTFREAFARRVDKLLASRQFGVHWGRHWLDVARYAESSGRDINVAYPQAWRFRDYVIDAFNLDKPYDEFLREQIAGDLLPAENVDLRAEQIIATGFLAVGSRALNEMNPRQFALDQADEQIDAVFQATMGLTVACARCHDHKFDPVAQKEYTAVAGVFLSTKTYYGVSAERQIRNPTTLIELSNMAFLPVVTKPIAATAFQDLGYQLDDINRQLQELKNARFQQAQSGSNNARGMDMQRSIRQQFNLEAQRAALELKLEEYDREGNPRSLAMGVSDKPSQPSFQPSFQPAARFAPRGGLDRSGFASISDSPFYSRGDIEMPGERIPRGVPTIFGSTQAFEVPANESGRLELARWITQASNPMTARVAVNRTWAWLIGQGLVTSVDNFGTTGTLPTHPELLDYLSNRFAQSGWNMKQLIREIVLSHTYQQSSAYHESHFAIDPDNAYLWRMNTRRLDAESIRDAVLSAAGKLDEQPQLASPVAHYGSGPVDRPESPYPRRGDNPPAPPLKASESNARSIYLPLTRVMLPEILELFDMPDATAVQGKRDTTNTPAQSLYMMNSPWIANQSRQFALRVLETYPGPSMEQIEPRLKLAYQLALGRSPSTGESLAAMSLLEQLGSSSETAWSSLMRGLLASAEFRYLD